MKIIFVLPLFISFLVGTVATAQERSQDSFWRQGPQLIKVDPVSAENDPNDSSERKCQILHRVTGTRVDRVQGKIVKTALVRYILGLDITEDATSCLSVDLTSVCDTNEKPDRAAIEFSTIRTNALYRENALYQLTGICRDSNDPRDVRLITNSFAQFEKIRRLTITSEWTELK